MICVDTDNYVKVLSTIRKNGEGGVCLSGGGAS